MRTLETVLLGAILGAILGHSIGHMIDDYDQKIINELKEIKFLLKDIRNQK